MSKAAQGFSPEAYLKYVEGGNPRRTPLTRVFARGVLEVRRGRKPAENAAHRKNSHLWMETN